MRQLHDWFINSFSRNPWMWVFLILFIIAERGNWQRGHELAEVCSLVPRGMAYAANPTVDDICANHELGADVETANY